MEGGRGVMDRDHGGADLVRGAACEARRPVRIVEEHEIGRERAQGRREPGAAERDPVAVRGGEADRRLLVPVGLGGIALASAAGGAGGTARHDEMVLERPGPGGELGLGLEVGADTAAALTVEQRHVGYP